MKTEFFATRDLARNAVEALNGKFKDFGKDAEKGKRWAVQFEEVQEATSETVTPVLEEVKKENIHVSTVNNVSSDDAIAILKRPGSIIGEQTLSTQNKKPVRVLWRRNLTATRLAAHIAATA